MTIFFQNSKFHRPIGLRGSKCVIVPNFAKIGRIIVEIWRFSDFRPPAYIFNKYSAGAEMGDRLATIDMSLKVRLCPPFFGGRGQLRPHLAQCGLGRGLYIRTKWHVDPSSRLVTIDTGRKLGALPPFCGEELDLHLTQCRLGRGVPPYQVACRSIRPFGHNTPTL